MSNITIEMFRNFVKNSIFTVEFKKADGTIRKMNARLGVSKYVKGTNPEATAKRKETNAERLQIGVYEMKGSSDRIEAANYRTISLAPDKLLRVTANGQTLVANPSN